MIVLVETIHSVSRYSEEIPESAQRSLRNALKGDGDDGGYLITRQVLDALPKASSEDEAFEVVGQLGECEIVAGGTAVTEVVLAGLRTRLEHPVQPGERLRLR